MPAGLRKAQGLAGGGASAGSSHGPGGFGLGGGRQTGGNGRDCLQAVFGLSLDTSPAHESTRDGIILAYRYGISDKALFCRKVYGLYLAMTYRSKVSLLHLLAEDPKRLDSRSLCLIAHTLNLGCGLGEGNVVIAVGHGGHDLDLLRRLLRIITTKDLYG